MYFVVELSYEEKRSEFLMGGLGAEKEVSLRFGGRFCKNP